MKIRKDSLFCLMVYILVFMNFPRWNGYNILKYIMIVVVAIYLCKYINIILKKRYRLVNIAAAVFSMILLYSSYVNQDIVSERNPFLAAIIFVAIMLEGLFFCEVSAYRGRMESTVKLFYYTSLVILIVVDFSIFVFVEGNIVDSYYLIGTKFFVSYFHVIVLALYMAKKQLENERCNNYYVAFLIVLTFIVSAKVDCATGIVLILLFTIGYLFLNRKSSFLKNPFVFLCVLISSFAFVFLFESILQLPVVQTIVVDWINRDMTLSSRTSIFTMVLGILEGDWLIGMGYGTSYLYGMNLKSFPNTQNGILEWVWQTGIIGTIAMLFFLGVMFAKIDSVEKKRKCNPILFLIYGFAIISAIEIVIDNIFIGLIVIVYACGLNEKNSDGFSNSKKVCK